MWKTYNVQGKFDIYFWLSSCQENFIFSRDLKMTKNCSFKEEWEKHVVVQGKVILQTFLALKNMEQWTVYTLHIANIVYNPKPFLSLNIWGSSTGCAIGEDEDLWVLKITHWGGLKISRILTVLIPLCVVFSFVCECASVRLCVVEVKSNLILQLNDMSVAASQTGEEMGRRNRWRDRKGQRWMNFKMFLWKVTVCIQVMPVISWLEITAMSKTSQPCKQTREQQVFILLPKTRNKENEQKVVVIQMLILTFCFLEEFTPNPRWCIYLFVMTRQQIHFFLGIAWLPWEMNGSRKMYFNDVINNIYIMERIKTKVIIIAEILHKAVI